MLLHQQLTADVISTDRRHGTSCCSRHWRTWASLENKRCCRIPQSWSEQDFGTWGVTTSGFEALFLFRLYSCLISIYYTLTERRQSNSPGMTEKQWVQRIEVSFSWGNRVCCWVEPFGKHVKLIISLLSPQHGPNLSDNFIQLFHAVERLFCCNL